MELIAELSIPLIIASVMLHGALKGCDVFGVMTRGAKKGLDTVLGILPALIVLLPGIQMLRACGLLEALCGLLSPLMDVLGVPPETLPLMLLRPLSGSGALAIGSDIISACGPDSLTGRCAAVMLGSTETTFYVVAVYFAAAGVKRSRHAVPAALIADLTGFVASAFFTRLFWR